MKSSFLEPQVRIDNPLGMVQELPVYKKVDAYYREIASEPIPEEYFQILRDSIKSYNDVYSPDKVVNVAEYDGYKWSQDGDEIKITYESMFDNDFGYDDIIITPPNKIDSPFCAGDFYGDIKDFSVKIEGKKVTIDLQVSEKWPILIIGGNMDPSSSFLLAAFSTSLKRGDLFEKLLVYGANKSHKYSMSSLAMHYAGVEQSNEKSFYWFTRYSLEHNDFVAQIMIAEYLIANNNEGQNAHICENLLINLAKMGLGQAFLYLGTLHLADSNGFNNDLRLSVTYFTVAHEQFNHPKAGQYLGHCYLSGIGVEQNIEKGADLLKQADIDPTPYLKRLKDKAQQEETQPKASEETTIQETVNMGNKLVDKLVAGAIVLGGMAAGMLLLSKVVQRRK